MKKIIFQFNRHVIKLILPTMFIFSATAHITAQTSNISGKTTASSQIPPEFISKTTFTVIKSANPILSFDETTPYFENLEIVDDSINLIENVVVTPVKDEDENVIKLMFNFSAVPPGTYYAKGMLTGTMVYYPINLTN